MRAYSQYEQRHEKTFFCIYEKGADQLRGNVKADQRLCFRYRDSSLNQNIMQPPFVFVKLCYVVGNPEYRFSRDEAHIIWFDRKID